MNDDSPALRPPQRFANALRRHGVEILFGQSNPPGLTLAADDIGIRQIGYRQENAGTYMADAYARVTGRVPVVTAQNGPAATLLVPGLAECLSASVPIVALVQDVGPNARDRNAFQELDQLELFKGVAKWIRRVTSASRIEDYVDMAFAAAAITSGSGCTRSSGQWPSEAWRGTAASCSSRSASSSIETSSTAGPGRPLAAAANAMST